MKLNAQSIVDSLPEAARRQLVSYEDLLRRRAIPLGLISAGDRPRLWERHILDSVRGAACLPRRAHTVADIGSGAGLPGIPIAVCRPDLAVTLIEPKARSAGFLELVVDRLGLGNVGVIVARAEASAIQADVCLARAVASPARTWRLASSLIGPGGWLVLWAGRSWPASGAAALVGPDVPIKICSRPGFSWQGPVVIMGGT